MTQQSSGDLGDSPSTAKLTFPPNDWGLLVWALAHTALPYSTIWFYGHEAPGISVNVSKLLSEGFQCP